MGLDVGPGEPRRPQARSILEQLGAHRIGQADVDHRDIAAEAAARLQHMRRLLAMEGNGQGAARRIAPGRREVAGQARRQVDRDDGEPRRLGRPQGRGGLRRQRLGKPGAEQGVHHQPGAVAGSGRQGNIQAGPGRGGFGRVALRARAGHGGGADLPTRLGQAPGRDVAIPAVVPRSAEDHHRSRGPASHDGVGDAGAGPLHQKQPGRSGVDGGAVGGRHLGDSEDLQPLGHATAIGRAPAVRERHGRLNHRRLVPNPQAP